MDDLRELIRLIAKKLSLYVDENKCLPRLSTLLSKSEVNRLYYKMRNDIGEDSSVYVPQWSYFYILLFRYYGLHTIHPRWAAHADMMKANNTYSSSSMLKYIVESIINYTTREDPIIGKCLSIAWYHSRIATFDPKHRANIDINEFLTKIIYDGQKKRELRKGCSPLIIINMLWGALSHLLLDYFQNRLYSTGSGSNSNVNIQLLIKYAHYYIDGLSETRCFDKSVASSSQTKD